MTRDLFARGGIEATSTWGSLWDCSLSQRRSRLGGSVLRRAPRRPGRRAAARCRRPRSKARERATPAQSLAANGRGLDPRPPIIHEFANRGNRKAPLDSAPRQCCSHEGSALSMAAAPGGQTSPPAPPCGGCAGGDERQPSCWQTSDLQSSFDSAFGRSTAMWCSVSRGALSRRRCAALPGPAGAWLCSARPSPVTAGAIGGAAGRPAYRVAPNSC